MNTAPISFVAKQAPRRRRPLSVPATTAGELELVSATYQSGASVTLTFNQAISISAIGPGDFVVSDGSGTGYLWVGMGANQPSANVVVVELELFESASAGPVLLTVNGANGIVPSAGGDPWPGVVELPLPYAG